VSAGFKVKRIVAPKVIAAATKKSSKQVDRLVKAGVDAKVKRFNECLEIAAAGGMIGMFGKEKANVLADALSEQFASMNIANSRKVARNVLSKVLAQHNNSIIKIATDLMKRDASVLSTYKEQIANMGGKIVAMDDQAEDDDETDYALESPESEESATIESRLERPMREARKPAVQTASVADGLKITGLFGKC
jgi:L-cysteine desulfidase